MGTHHGGARLDQGDGIVCVSWVRDIGWIRAMGLIYRGAPWGHVTGSGDGSDLWGRAMGARDTG